MKKNRSLLNAPEPLWSDAEIAGYMDDAMERLHAACLTLGGVTGHPDRNPARAKAATKAAKAEALAAARNYHKVFMIAALFKKA